MTANGWFKDPYGFHEDRWISDGKPTKLVRDAGTEGMDPPPNSPAPEPFTRADELESGSLGGKQRGLTPRVVDALLNAIPQMAHPS